MVSILKIHARSSFAQSIHIKGVGLKKVQIQPVQRCLLFIMISDILQIRVGFSCHHERRIHYFLSLLKKVFRRILNLKLVFTKKTE